MPDAFNWDLSLIDLESRVLVYAAKKSKLFWKANTGMKYWTKGGWNKVYPWEHCGNQYKYQILLRPKHRITLHRGIST